MTARSLRLAVIVPMVAAIAVIATVAYLIAGNTGLLISVIGIQLALLTAVLLVARNWRRSDPRQRDDQAMHQRIDEMDAELAAVRTNVNKRAQELKNRLGTVRYEIAATRTRLDRRVGQLDYLIGLYYDLRPDTSLPATAGWAASPDLLRFLYDTVREHRRRSIVECGSGVSTVIMAYALREAGEGQITCLEHDDRYAEQTRELLKRHELQRWVDVRVAKLQPVTLADEEWQWYDTAALPTGEVDLLLVDGPPEATGPQARYPAVPLLRPRFTSDAMVVLDDYGRPDEQAAAQRWQEQFPDMAPEILKHHKDTLVLRRGV